MSEELSQGGYTEHGTPFGPSESIGNTTLQALARYGIVPRKNYGDVANFKPDVVSADRRNPSDLPIMIRQAFVEPSTALHAGCPRAATAMARRTLKAVTEVKGETQGRLAELLANLAAAGKLDAMLANWAKEVLQIGNTAANHDLINPVSMDEAKQVLGFLRELLRYLYELPAELARRRSQQSTT